MKPSEGILKNINVLNILLISVSAIMFSSLAYPLFTAEMGVHLPITKKASVGREKTGAAEDISMFSEYFVLSENAFLRPLLPTVTPKKDAAKLEDSAVTKEKTTVLEKIPTGLDFIVVAEKNLFHPERRMPADKKGEQALVRPDIIFYGAIITSDKRIAYVEDKKNPHSTPGRGKRQTPITEGAMIGGYKLTEVNPESIVLVRGDDRMVVNLRDHKERHAPEMPAGMNVPAKQSSRPTAVPPPGLHPKPAGSPSPLVRPQSPLPIQRPGPKSLPSSSPQR